MLAGRGPVYQFRHRDQGPARWLSRPSVGMARRFPSPGLTSGEGEGRTLRDGKACNRDSLCDFWVLRIPYYFKKEFDKTGKRVILRN